MKRFISIILTISIFLCVMIVDASADENTDDINAVYETIEGIISWKNIENGGSSDSIINTDMIENAGSSIYDWFVLSMGRLGKNDDYDAYTAALQEYVASGRSEIITDYQRISLTLSACGADDGESGALEKAVLSSLNDDNMSEKTVNALIYALLTLDSVQYGIPEGTNLSRTSLIIGILSSRLENGAFALSGSVPDTDITAMAIQALAPYYNSRQLFTYTSNGEDKTASVREVVDSAVDYLSSVQLDDGDMPSWGKATCEGTAQTIIALCTMGINPNMDERFIKNGNSLIDGLMKYSVKDGGFAHTVDGDDMTSNPLASVQSLYSLCAYCRLCNGYRNLFDMRQEQSGELYSEINSLIKSINSMNTDDEEVLGGLLERYSDIPINERFYVRNFSKLADALDDKGIENTADYSADDMYDSAEPAGTAVNVTERRTVAGEADSVIESPDSAVQPLPSEVQSSTAVKDHTEFNSTEVTILTVILLIAIAVILINHRRKKAADK